VQQKKKYWFWLIAIVTGCQQLLAQDPIPINNTSPVFAPDSLITVGDIIITGNKKTKAIIILREIPFRSGENTPWKPWSKNLKMPGGS
jgi:hypothetical protein